MGVIEGDEAVGIVGEAGVGAGVQRAVGGAGQGAGELARHRHLAGGRHRERQAAGGPGRAEGAGIDQLAGRIVLHQRHVLGALNSLAGHLAGDVGQHIDRAVGGHLGGVDRADRGLHVLRPDLAVHLGGLAWGRGDGIAVGLDLQQLAVGHPVLGGGVLVGIGVAHGLGDIDGGGGGHRGERDRVPGIDLDLESPLIGVRPDHHGLAAHLHRAVAAGNALGRHPGGDAGGGKLVVDIGDHIAQGPRRAAHLAEVDGDVVGRPGPQDAHIELHIPLQGGDLGIDVAGDQGGGLIGVAGEGGGGHGGRGLGRVRGRAPGDARLAELQAVGIGLDLGEAAGEHLLDLVRVAGGEALALHLVGDGREGAQALIEGEQLLVVVAGARQVELGGGRVDQLAADHRLLDRGGLQSRHVGRGLLAGIPGGGGGVFGGRG